MEQSCRAGHSFSLPGIEVEVFPADGPDRPIVYLNTFDHAGGQVDRALRDGQCPDFTLVAVSGLDWDQDMSPWAIPPIAKNDTPCTGGADAYLARMTAEIIPEAERLLPGRISWRGLAGYSLAGLFALYSLYQTELFSRAASVSGSLWFPGFREYVFSHEMKRRPERVYLSLGSGECRTRNRYLKTVQEDTEAIYQFYKRANLEIVFQLNPGNHFQDAVRRTASGIAWLLSR